jgi:hypothetical protein
MHVFWQGMVHDHITTTWMGLRWSAWMPLMAAHPLALAQLPSQPGLYRIRRTDQPERLEWIAWEARGVREVVERLSRQVHMPVLPYDDPHSPARALWQLRRDRGISFDVSGAPLDVDDTEGRATLETLREAYRTFVANE